MGKKILITFDENPAVGIGFNYKIDINGVSLVYPNGFTEVIVDYQVFGGGDPSKVEVSGATQATIANTLAFLVDNYSTAGISYAIVDNTVIEASIDIDAFITVYLSAINPAISIDSEDISLVTTINLKYFFQYKNIVNDTYLCEIFKKNYIGGAQEIHGTAIIEKASVNNHLDPIRGGGISLKLEASKDVTLEDLYSESEQDLSVKLYRNSKLIFQGYLNPDGVYQDYVKDEWIITLDCVDGLGAISNLSFVKDNGLNFTGKMLVIDIIYHCLKRTGIHMPINTSVNILYDGLPFGSDVFSNVKLNANRFIRKDDETKMSCEDVLKSILDIFKACITQSDGEWYIYKPNEIFFDPYVLFRRFDINNIYKGTKTVNLNKSLGSQIDNFYPHHCGSNQRIEIRGSIGGFRLGYKYGLVSGLLNNPGLVKNNFSLSYDNWTVNDPYYLLNDPFQDYGFYFRNTNSLGSTTVTVKSDPIAVTIDDEVSMKMDYNVTSKFGSSFVKMQIKQGIYYLDYTPKNSETPLDDFKNAVWSTDSTKYIIFYLPGKKGSITLNFPKIQSDNTLTIAIIACQNLGANSTTFISSLDIIPSQSTGSPEGEFHTVERNGVSSIVKANQTVYNGDNADVVYLGAIYNSSNSPTTLWTRKNSADKFPLLRIAAEEELRIAQRPTKVFRGDFYGYIPYMSLTTINNIGKFMFIEWAYDTATNVTTCKHLELFAGELMDIVYNYTMDYGETVKPTIK